MRILVHVKTKAAKDSVKEVAENEYEVKVRELPVKGRANRAVIKALAGYFGVPTAQVNIIIGKKLKNKIVEIA